MKKQAHRERRLELLPLFSSNYGLFLPYSSHLSPPRAHPSGHGSLLSEWFSLTSLAQVLSFTPWVSGKKKVVCLLSWGLAQKDSYIEGLDISHFITSVSWPKGKAGSARKLRAGHATEGMERCGELVVGCLNYPCPWRLILGSRPQQQTFRGSGTSWSHTSCSTRA